MQDDPAKPSASGLPEDPIMFKVMTEISILSHMIAVEFEQLLPHGLTGAQYGILNHLVRLNVSESVGDLAKAFQVTQPTMSSTVRKLEEKELIRIVEQEGDRRVKLVEITDLGRIVRQNTVEAVKPHYANVSDEAKSVDWPYLLEELAKIRRQFELRRNS